MQRVVAVCGFLLLSRHTLVDAQRPTFRSGIEMVPLTVTVTDATGKYKTGLNAADFAVFEDGVRQTVSFFAIDPVPVDIVFVVDTSSSMSNVIPLVKSALHGLVKELRDDDRSAIVEIKTSVSMPLPLTADRGAVHAAIDALRSSGSTAMHDGVYLALREFERVRRQNHDVRRHVLILLSDGLDTSSHVTFETTSDLARRLGVSVYTIALKTTSVATPPEQISRYALESAYAIRALASDSGGRAFSPAVAAELPTVYAAIGQELACQYQMGYVPTTSGGGEFRRVSVRVLPPTQATARTRNGYFAMRASRPAA